MREPRQTWQRRESAVAATPRARTTHLVLKNLGQRAGLEQQEAGDTGEIILAGRRFAAPPPPREFGGPRKGARQCHGLPKAIGSSWETDAKSLSFHDLFLLVSTHLELMRKGQ